MYLYKMSHFSIMLKMPMEPDKMSHVNVVSDFDFWYQPSVLLVVVIVLSLTFGNKKSPLAIFTTISSRVC